MSKDPSYKVVYFNARGRAEPARMMLTLAGKAFEDVRFEREEWPKKKEDKTLFPLGRCPVLVVDGNIIPQSKAMCRYLAMELGFYGDNNMEVARMDVVTETLGDLEKKTMALFFEKDEAKKAQLVKEFIETSSKPYLPFLEKVVKENGGKFFVGKKMSVADMVVFNMFDLLTNSDFKIPGCLDAYPGLLAFMKSFRDDSVLTSYLNSRKATPT